MSWIMKNGLSRTTICCICLISSNLPLQSLAQFIQFDEARMTNAKRLLSDGKASEATQLAYHRLIARADKCLTIKNPSVIEKTIVPPSGDKHDYLSISRYWWPNPETDNGLPWVRKDGDTNPKTQTGDVDRQRLSQLGTSIKDLSLAYFFTKQERYAEKGVSILRTWFLNDSTKMNPNLEYAQSIPGRSKQRPTGILDGRVISTNILDAIQIFSSSDFWTDHDNDSMNTWLTNYLTWLTESDLGIAGAQQQNNHGSWYRFHVGALAYYLGRQDILSDMIKDVKTSLDDQLNLNGGQTHELERTKSFFYSCFNLDAMTQLAILAERNGKSIWDYVSEGEKSFALALEYLIPVIAGEPWEHPSRGPDVSYLVPILDRMARGEMKSRNEELIREVLAQISKEENPTKGQKALINYFALIKGEYFISAN